MPTAWFLPALQPLIWVALSTFLMYLGILLLARWSGVRSFAEMSVFDISITIAIGSIIATTVVAKNPPIIHGVTAVGTLFLLQWLVSRCRFRFAGIQSVTDNSPILLMDNGGVIKHANLQVARVTEDDVRAHLRQANVLDPAAVQAVVMEGTGQINVLHHHGRSVGTGDWVMQNIRDYSGDADGADMNTHQGVR